MSAARTITSSILVLGVTTVLVAQAPALDVKLGLWESTTVTDLGGAAMPQMDMSKLPPEQAAKIAEAMKGLTGDRTVTCEELPDEGGPGQGLLHDAGRQQDDLHAHGHDQHEDHVRRRHQLHRRTRDQGPDQRGVARRR